MDFDHVPINIIIISMFVALGLWLESINGKHGLFDRLLTWFPMGFVGTVWVIGKAVLA